MKNIKIILQYDGTNYSGWQIQKKGVTIQGLLEEALFKITGKITRITGAARTDAGVHALQQVAAFRTGSFLEPDIFTKALNGNLPADLRVIKAEECKYDFHPRYDAKSKTYSYLIFKQDTYAVFLERYSWVLPYTLNCDSIKEAAGYLIGEHDFSCFRASGCSSRHPVRTIYSIEATKLPSIEFIGFQFNVPVIKISITANAFLRHMARNIVGTLVDTGRGKINPSRMEEILRSKDRKLAGRTAPAHGLFLEKIIY